MTFSGYSKILVGLGSTKSGRTNNFEIIDLESSTSKCPQVSSYPSAIYGAMGGIGMNKKPIICGGVASSYVSNCYSLDQTWQPLASLKTALAHAAAAPSPFKSHQIVISGGSTGSSQNFVDVLNEKDWERLPASLPTALHAHCMVLMNSTTLMTIGGHNGNTIPNTYILNAWSQSWVDGPPLKYSRYLHSCSRIKKNINSQQEYSIVAAGGVSVASVELLDEGASQWRDGPELPVKIYAAQMVEDPLGGVIVIGGLSSVNSYSDKLYRLAHAGEGAHWIEMPQKLTTGRQYHTAIMVPDNIVNCTIF